MADIDVFNGDADGIISLVQLRLSEPRPNAQLVTGRKRDIILLDRVEAGEGDRVTVLDISMRSNAADVLRILDAGADVFYADHHNAGDIPERPNLTALIDTSPEMCTAVLVDTYLKGAHRAWAVAAAFGDNFPRLARELAGGTDWPLAQLERLGTLVNYNGYGGSVDDLLFHPAELYAQLVPFSTPMAFMFEKTDIFEQLEDGFESDMASVNAAKILDSTEVGTILVLPDDVSSRRASGVFGNQLAQENPNKAHAILTAQGDGFLVSIRAPISRRTGGDTLALQFETGGGRSAAAGINNLPGSELDRFVEAFRAAFKVPQ